MEFFYSFIVPVYNRPDEIDELLLSISTQTDRIPFEVVVVEDGSTATCNHVLHKYASVIDINYFQKENTGPGDSRNYGMQHAKGNFFIILDSDVILPTNYLKNVNDFLNENKVECFGGPDLAHPDFTNLQKAIDFTMTSFLTTGGIRGNQKQIQPFEPRSFNMGISKQLFYTTQGFTNIHPGEDPDLSIRIQKLGFQTLFLPTAGVYHKRRISWKKFFQQVYKFGLVRPILFKKHPETIKLSYFFPSVFSLFLGLSIIFSTLGHFQFIILYGLYFLILVFFSFAKYKSFSISLYVSLAALTQFTGYGLGFVKSVLFIHLFQNEAEKQFPFLFYPGKHKF